MSKGTVRIRFVESNDVVVGGIVSVESNEYTASQQPVPPVTKAGLK